jgi:hypothetical protein
MGVLYTHLRGIRPMKTKIAFKQFLGLACLLTLAACGGSKTQSKVDGANDDYRRMQIIDGELRSLGVNLLEPAPSAANIELLDESPLQRARVLLGEFISRGENVGAVARRRDVSVNGDAMSNVDFALRQANRLKMKVLEVIQRRTGSACERTSYATARQAARAFAASLGPDVASSLREGGEVERVSDGCDLVRVTFRHRSNPSCRLRLTMDGGHVDQSRSDRAFVCR